MECVSCGSQLRADARFCNVCGARQDSPIQREESFEGQPDGQGDMAGDSGRVKRPPRVPRPSDGSEVEPPHASNVTTTETLPEPSVADIQPNAEVAEAEATFAEPAAAEIPEANIGDFYAPAPEAAASAEASAEPVTTPAETRPTDEQETEERPIVVTFAGAVQSQARDDMPPLTDLSREARPGDLPWPLPTSIIVGGRYRVEVVTSTEPEGEGATNTYRVSDLQGYERCWSCGTEYGTSSVSDRFCRECGADMLAREYVMVEQRLTNDAAPQESNTGVTSPEAEIAPQIENADVTDTADGAHPAPPAETPGAASDSAPAGEHTFVQGARAYRVSPYEPEPSLFPRGPRLTAAAASNEGATRSGEHNEDSVGALLLNLTYDSHTQPLALCMVADGLGGHANGQDASQLVVRSLTEHILRRAALPLATQPSGAVPPEDALRQMLLEGASTANAAVFAANTQMGADMGSTLVAALVCGETAYILNAGDSRAYVFEDGNLKRITTDHSLVEQLIEAGQIQPDDRYTHPMRNQIYRSLGEESAQPDLYVQRLKPGMRLLLCSDGLWEMVRDPDMAAILAETADPRAACDALVVRANENGGEDNISAVLLDVSA